MSGESLVFCPRCGQVRSLYGVPGRPSAAKCAACARAISAAPAADFRGNVNHQRSQRTPISKSAFVIFVVALIVLFALLILRLLVHSSSPMSVSDWNENYPPSVRVNPQIETPPMPPRVPTLPQVQLPQVPNPPVFQNVQQTGWTGSFLLASQGGAIRLFVNGASVFQLAGAATRYSPELTLHTGDIVAVQVAGGGVIRAGFITTDGKQVLPIRASDWWDVSENDLSELTAEKLSAVNDSAVQVLKVPAAEVQAWENSGVQPPPHGSEFVTGREPNIYALAFSVGDRSFRPVKPSPTFSQHRLFQFDDEAVMAKSWKWKANLQMSPAGASGPAEADNELVSRFLMYGDFTVDLDASFGAAANLDTSGLAISVCGKELSFDSDRTASNADQTDVKLRVQRIGDELQLIRGDEAKVMALAPGVGGSPTHWRLWWRSRTCQFREIRVAADRIVSE